MKTLQEIKPGDILYRVCNLQDLSKPEGIEITRVETHSNGSRTFYTSLPIDIYRDDYIIISSLEVSGTHSGHWFTDLQEAYQALIKRYEDWIASDFEKMVPIMKEIEEYQETLRRLRENLETSQDASNS